MKQRDKQFTWKSFKSWLTYQQLVFWWIRKLNKSVSIHYRNFEIIQYLLTEIRKDKMGSPPVIKDILTLDQNSFYNLKSVHTTDIHTLYTNQEIFLLFRFNKASKMLVSHYLFYLYFRHKDKRKSNQHIKLLSFKTYFTLTHRTKNLHVNNLTYISHVVFIWSSFLEMQRGLIQTKL